VLSGIDGLGHSLFLREERPEVWDATWKLLEPADYLGLRLTGEARASFASMFPYWLTDNRDPDAVAYDETLLRWAGVPRDKLPDLVAPDGRVGALREDAAAELGLPAGVPVLPGMPDLNAATVGAGAAAPGTGYFYVGTTGWLSCHVETKRTDLRHQLGTMPAALPGRYCVVAEQGLAGRCLEWLQQTLVDEPYEELSRMADGVRPGCDGLVFLPWLGGVAVPADDPHTRGAFLGQSWRTTRAHHVRAVMEGIAFNMRWLRPHVEKLARTRFEPLTFIGGAAQSDVWCQIFADVLGVPIRRVAEPRLASAVGCGLLAHHALGTAADPTLGVPIDRVFGPDRSTAEAYDRAFDAFLRFYRATRPVYRRFAR
jgi:xylulokinase